MDAPPKPHCPLCIIRQRLGEIPRVHVPTLACRLGWHRWKRWTFARSEGLRPMQKDKQYRYCQDCNFCDERPIGFYIREADVD